MAKQIVNLYLPSSLILKAKQAAFERGYIWNGEGNLSKWVAKLIADELGYKESTSILKDKTLPIIRGKLRPTQTRPPIIIDFDGE